MLPALCTVLTILLALFALLAVSHARPGMATSSLPSDANRRRGGREPRPSAGVFVRALLSNPRAVGACCPSSPRLARAVAAAVDASAAGLVVELGGGTGAITSALLARGVPPERLVVVERDPALARHLKERFRGVSVIGGDAVELARLLAHQHGEPRAATVVSSLPMISLSTAEVREIGAQICAVLERGGSLVQYTYQIALGHARVPGCLKLVASDRVWINLPPARVEVYRHLD
jgi:phospholipid N-methyltransferase